MKNVSNIENAAKLSNHRINTTSERIMGLLVIATLFLRKEEIIELLIEFIDFLIQENGELTELIISQEEEAKELFSALKEVGGAQDAFREEYKEGIKLLEGKVEGVADKVEARVKRERQIKIKAAEARHGEGREIKEQVIEGWKEYAAQQAALGRKASKNQYSEKVAKELKERGHGYSANTVRKNWLQGI